MTYQAPQAGNPFVAWLTCEQGHVVTPGFQFCPQCGGRAILSASGGVADPTGPTGLAGPGVIRSHGDPLSDWWASNGIGGGPQGSPAPAELLTWRRAGAWRLIGGFVIDFMLVWVLGGLTLVLPVLGEIAILAIAFVNCYLEGSTGQSLGKKAVGIYVVKRDTGEFLGGWAGIGRQLLHILDYLPLCIGFVIGLFNTRTFADMIVGSTVVARPRTPQLPSPPPL